MVNEVALANVPVPFDVQLTPALFVAEEPAVMFTALELEQVFIAVPATAVAGWLMVIVLVEVTLEQVPLPVAVNVKVLDPAVISAALGV